MDDWQKHPTDKGKMNNDGKDKLGRFTKGHKFSPGGKKKRSTIIKEFIKKHPMAVDELMDMLYNLAMDKTDKEAAQYIIDRLKGRPHQSLDIKGQVTITPAELKLQVIALRQVESGAETLQLGAGNAAEQSKE